MGSIPNSCITRTSTHKLWQSTSQRASLICPIYHCVSHQFPDPLILRSGEKIAKPSCWYRSKNLLDPTVNTLRHSRWCNGWCSKGQDCFLALTHTQI